MIFDDKPTTARVLPCSRISRMGSDIRFLGVRRQESEFVRLRLLSFDSSLLWIAQSAALRPAMRRAALCAIHTSLLASDFCLLAPGKNSFERPQELLVFLVSSHRHAKAGGETVKLHGPHDHAFVQQADEVFFTIPPGIHQQ